MYNTIYIFLIAVLLFIVYQDVTRRRIHVVLPVCVFGLSLFVNYSSKELTFINVGYNIGFVMVNVLGLVLYYSIKSKNLINPVDRFIGLGDIVFFIAITPLFNLKEFILFFIIGLFFSLLVHIIMVLFKKRKTIPLAGYLSLFLIVNVVITYVFQINITF
ncbi:hypothetical protein A8C32_10445 [Flavivirga aquatica]|uniref:Prepilin type IV endopeptidase peptidase domain-containing protein n=1 Tax=Flavivirga aquatica TaxID=1849968 RepID=A0A1E5TCP5_9FLAO|nr:prepilin peptidase [Flavivirga aquatica]OEK09145.1 hypothetical protein A8C32_10445 [Flavivirga aquatica]